MLKRKLLFLQCGWLPPVLLKPAFLFILFQKGSELSQKMWIIFHSIVYSKNKGTTIYFPDTVHQEQIFDGTEDFHAVYINFQHSVFYCSDRYCVHLCFVHKKNCAARTLLFVKKWCQLQMCLLQWGGKGGSFLSALLQYLYVCVTCYMVPFVLRTGSFNMHCHKVKNMHMPRTLWDLGPWYT
jgi:hypothetical protein